MPEWQNCTTSFQQLAIVDYDVKKEKRGSWGGGVDVFKKPLGSMEGPGGATPLPEVGSMAERVQMLLDKSGAMIDK